jgi:hypothetical protein
MLDIAIAYPYRLCHYNINKIILGPCPISHFPNMPLCNRVMSISTCSEQSQNKLIFISFSFGNTIFRHLSIWEMEGLVIRYFKFIWWFAKFGGEVAPDVFEFQSRLN